MYKLEDIEKRLNVRLPEKYKNLFLSDFREIENKRKIYIEADIFCIERFLSAFDIYNLLEEDYEFFGYDLIPIAEAEFGDYICLYYDVDRENPSIVYWDYEFALADSKDQIKLLYANINEFINNLR